MAERQAAFSIGARPGRFRLARPAVALALGILVPVLSVAGVPLASLAHRPFGFGDVSSSVLYVSLAGVGAAVAWHQPANRLGWMLVLAATCFAVAEATSLYAVLAYRIHHGAFPLGRVAVLLQPSWTAGVVLLGIAVQLFPDGALPAGRWRWVVWALLAGGSLWVGGAFAIAVHAVAQGHVHVAPGGELTAYDRPGGVQGWWSQAGGPFFLLIAVSWLSWLARQVVGFRRSTGERRLQLKWLLTGAAIAVACGSLSDLLTSVTSSDQGFLKTLGDVATLGVAALPLSIGVGILKFRLYEIDRLISRTLSYAIVTGFLAGVFIGGVVLTTRVLPFSSPVGVAASTLAAAALFDPLRRRVQRLVDRRFNRSRYDAEAVVAAFSARLRDPGDLDAVRAELLQAVQRAVEPSHASVWIRAGR
jgi:hypothetical protein